MHNTVIYSLLPGPQTKGEETRPRLALFVIIVHVATRDFVVYISSRAVAQCGLQVVGLTKCAQFYLFHVYN